MVWNCIIAGLTLIGTLMIGRGLYQTMFTRRWQYPANAWLVRGVLVMCLPVYLYLTYRYTGKIFLTKQLNIIILAVIWVCIYELIVGYLDKRRMRREIDVHPGDKTYIIELIEADKKHYNAWNDIMDSINFVKLKISQFKEHRDLTKTRQPQVKIEKGRKKKGDFAIVPTNNVGITTETENQIMQNRNLSTNTLKPRLLTNSTSPEKTEVQKKPVVNHLQRGGLGKQANPTQPRQQTQPINRQSGGLGKQATALNSRQSGGLGRQGQQMQNRQSGSIGRQSSLNQGPQQSRPTQPTMNRQSGGLGRQGQQPQAETHTMKRIRNKPKVYIKH